MNKALMYVLVLTGLTALGGFVTLGQGTTDPTLERNKAVVRRIAEEVLNQGKFEVVDQIIAPDVIQHNPFIAPGREAYKKAFIEFRTAFPDLRVTPQDVIAEGDRVVVRSSFTGTQKAAGFGLPLTGKAVNYQAMDIFRIKDGQIVEHWDVVDNLSFYSQLGIVQIVDPTKPK